MAKKIMFNDKYGLTQAVLDGRKTMTRRVYKLPAKSYGGLEIEDNKIITFDISGEEIATSPKYYIGEVVAIAQPYRNIAHPDDGFLLERYEVKDEYVAGWANKMFVRADLMPHHIRITNIKFEKLQSISEEDCLKEGVIKRFHSPACRNFYYVPNVEVKSKDDVYLTSQEAFSALIDRISCKGTWKSNPYVFVYEFELID